VPYFEGLATAKHWRSSPGPINAGQATIQGSFVVFPLDADGDPMAGSLLAKTLAWAMSYNWTNTSVSQIFSSTYRIGIYTRSISTLNLINSASGFFGATAAATGNSGSFQGHRFITVNSSQFSVAPIFSPDQRYFLAIQLLTHITTTAMSWMNAASFATAFSRRMYTAGAPNATHQPYAPIRGLFNATTTAVPTTIQASQVSGSGTNGSFFPWVRLDEDLDNY